MNRWERIWNARPRLVGPTDYFRQVGKTVGGRSLSEKQFQCMVSEICQRLALQPTDIVLDLCCGNGIITKEIAKNCREIIGVDFSRPLLEVANRDHGAENVTYYLMSALDVDKMPRSPSIRFNKVLLYDALQHFDRHELIQLLKKLVALTSDDRLIFLGGLPHRKRKWRFYNTWQKKLLYMMRKLTREDLIGTWWDEEFIRETCGRLNLHCEFHEQSRDMYNAHFRFDVTIC